MKPFDVYCNYLSIKRHFSEESYDYIKYRGKTRASLESYHKRKDRYWFEKLGRQKTDTEIFDFFLSNFIHTDNPKKLWIRNIIKDGEEIYLNWKKLNESLSYRFKETMTSLLEKYTLTELFDFTEGHSIILKQYLANRIDIEILVILDQLYTFTRLYDKKLNDPIWDSISLKIKKYSPFLQINTVKYKHIIRSITHE